MFNADSIQQILDNKNMLVTQHKILTNVNLRMINADTEITKHFIKKSWWPSVSTNGTFQVICTF